MAAPLTPGPRGVFIALEGPDGGGKTTQARRLVAYLEGRVPEVVACRDPGGTDLGERLRSILMDRSATAIGMRAEMLLYMASRAQLVDDVIRPALDRGAVVVSDRFLLSNVVYQGYAGGLDPEDVWAVGLAATGRLLPDLTLLIDIPPDVATARVGPPRDRIEDRPASYREHVRAGYLRAVAGLPSLRATIDGRLGPDQVFAAIRSEVDRALGFSAGA